MKSTSKATSGDLDSRAVDFRDPRNHKAAANGREGAQYEPGYHHPEGEIEGGFGLMVVRPDSTQQKIYGGGDKDPRDQTGQDGGNCFHDQAVLVHGLMAAGTSR